MPTLNATHDPKLRSWLASADDPATDFPIQNLPFGVFTSAGDPTPRVGVAIGDQILDLAALESAGMLIAGPGGRVFDRPSLNAYMALGPGAWSRMRARLSELLRHDSGVLRDHAALRQQALVAQRDARLHRPMDVPGYTDFYASKEHATNVGSMFRDPKNALLPNWVHLPVGYNGRASTVVVSGTPIRRPLGQIKPPGSEAPVFSPCRRLDFELEMGAVVGTPNAMGTPLTVAQAQQAIFGYVLLNDWSARDIQQWEYVPLGPFQAKVFATSISPWIVTAEALEPYRVEGPRQEPEPLPYLRQQGPHNYDVRLEVALHPVGAAGATIICRSNFRHMYWSGAQQLAHHAIGGCAMETGDLLGSGTISGSNPGSFGSLLELAWNGTKPVPLDDGGTRSFIEDGDEVVMRGWCAGRGPRIGFGEVTGRILPAPPPPA